ncbi:MAG: AMP-binding protein, partial [Calditrichia bacterium]
MFIKNHDKTALIWKNLQIGYAELLKNIHHYSELFKSENPAKVAIFSENRPEWVNAMYAGWRNGAIVVPIDFMSTTDEVAYILNDCQPEVVFCSKEKLGVMNEALASVSHDIRVIVFEDIPEAGDEMPAEVLPEFDKDKTALIIYTSGTTGSPKGVMLSFDNLLANIESVSESVRIFDADQRVLVLLPLHHIFPLVGSVIAPLYVGGTSVFSPSMASEDILETLQKYQINIIIGVPRFYSLIRKGIREKINHSAVTRLLFSAAGKINSRAFSKTLFKTVHKKFGGKIKYLVCGGAALDPEIGSDFKTLGFEVLEGFGMTEAAPMITFTRPGRVKVGSAGEAIPTLTVDVQDGEIVARGRNIMQGYYNRPEETDAVLQDGWLHTGDLGYFDEEGFIHLTGRKKEILVLSNGKNVNPEEIEHKIAAMSDLVSEIGVFIKDDMLQALIYPDFRKIQEMGIADVEENFRWNLIDKYNQSVSPYKKVMKFFIVKEELPKTRLEKLRRFMLPEIAGSGTRQKKIAKEPDYSEYHIIREFLEKQSDRKVYSDDHLEIDLALDSLDKVSLVSFLNATFGVDIKENELAQFSTVEKIADHIRENKSKIDVEAVDWGEILREQVNLNLPQSWFTHTLIKQAAKVFLRLYFRLKGEGFEKLPSGPFILAPNHQSFFDGLFVTVFLKNKLSRRTYFYAKEKHVRKPWVKFIANRHNVIVMDLNRDLKQSLQKMAAALKNGKNVMIFPEGTRTKDGELGKFKKTFAILSRELNVPVV